MKQINRTHLNTIGLLALFFCSLSIRGQSLWPLRAGGDDVDSGQSIAYSINDNVFVTGTFKTTVADAANFGNLGTDFTSDTNSTDIYVGQLTEYGDWSWLATVGGIEEDYSYGIAVDEQENVYITGSFSGTMAFNNNDGSVSAISLTSAVSQAFVAKLNFDGDWVWAKKIDSSGTSTGRSIALFKGQGGVTNVYISGEFNGTAGFGGLADLTTTHKTGFVAMLKGNTSNWRWSRKIDGSGESAVLDIAVGAGTSTEGIERPYLHLTGYFQDSVSFGSHGKTSAGGKDIFYSRIQSNSDMIVTLSAERASQLALKSYYQYLVVYYTSERTWISAWGNCIYGDTYCWAFGHRNYGCVPQLVCIDPRWVYNTNWVWTYFYYTNLINTYTIAISNTNSRIAQLDSLLAAGEMSWNSASTAGSAMNDTGYGVALDTLPGNGAYITGEFRSQANFSPWAGGVNSADFPMEAKGEVDVFVAKINGSGQFLWTKPAGVVPPEGNPAFVPLPTSSYSIAVDDQGSAYIAGAIFGSTTFGDLEPVDINSDFVDKLSDQLLLAEARKAEISTPGATAYGHYVLYKAKYLLDTFGWAPSESGPWNGTYRLSTLLGVTQTPREWVLSEIGNPYNASNNFETMLGFVFGGSDWPDLQVWTDGNVFNGELSDVEITIDVNGHITDITWERNLANSKHILTEMGLAPAPGSFPYDSPVDAAGLITYDLSVIRGLLPASPTIPTAAQVTSPGGEMLDGNCTNPELISVQFANVTNTGAGDFIWTYIDPAVPSAGVLSSLDPTIDVCSEFDGTTTTAHTYSITHFTSNTNQTSLATLFTNATPPENPPSGGTWAAKFTEWTDGDSANNLELDTTVAVTYTYTPNPEGLTVTFHLYDDSGSATVFSTHVVGFSGSDATNPHQTVTHTLSSSNTTLDSAGDYSTNVNQVDPTQDCPLSGNIAPCIWELYSIYQAEYDQLDQTITNLINQIATIGSTNQANQDAMLAKINTDGTWARATAGGGPATDVALDIVAGPNGKIYVTGSFQQAAILGGLSPVTAYGTDPVDVDAFVTRLDSFLFGSFKRWVIGREVAPPLAAINQSTNAAWGPPVGIYNGAGDLEMDAFFWIDDDLPENRKLYAIKPGSYQIEWPWELFGQQVPFTGSGPCASGILDVDGNCYDPLSGVQPAVYGPIPATGISEWPPNPQIHIAGVPVDVNPPVNLTPDDPDYRFHSLAYSHFDTIVVDNVFTNPVPDTYSVLIYMQDLKPTRIEVVHTLAFEESPLLEDQTMAIIGKRVSHPVHEDNSGKNGYVLTPKARYDMVSHDRQDRTGPIIPVNTSEDAFGQLAPTKEVDNPTIDNPALINGVPYYDDDLIVVWYKLNDIGTAWPQVPVRYVPQWPASVGKVRDFATDYQDVTPNLFSDAYDFALDLKNNHMFWTDISTGQIMRTDRDGSRSSDTDTLLTTFSITPGTPPYDLDALNTTGYSHGYISNQANLDDLIPQLPTGEADPANWSNTFTSWSNGTAGVGDPDGELVNILVDVLLDGSAEVTWIYDISTSVTDILDLFTHTDPFLTPGSWPETVDFNTLLGASDVHTFLSTQANLNDFLLLLPVGVSESNWTRLLGEWTDGTINAVNGELTNVIMLVYEDGHADLTFQYDINDGTVQHLELSTQISAEGGFHRSLTTSLSGPRVLVSDGLVGPKGISVDLVADKLYWTDSSTRKIQRSNLDGTEVENVIETRLEEPIGLALDTTDPNANNHRMYWADKTAKKLYRAYLHDTRPRMTQSVLDLFQVAMGIYDLNEIYGFSPDAQYGGLSSTMPAYGGIYSGSKDFLINRKSDLAALLNGFAYQLDGSVVGDMLPDFNIWTDGDEIANHELDNMHVSVHGNGTSELRFLLNQYGVITTETLHLNKADTYTLLAFFLEQLNFSMNTVFGNAFSYDFVRDPIQAAELVAVLPAGVGEPDWAILFQEWTDGDSATGTMSDLHIHVNTDGSSNFSVDYIDAGGTLQTVSSISSLAIGSGTANLMAVFFNRARTYDMDLIGGNGTSYEFLSQNIDAVEAFLLPIGFSNTYAYRTFELDNPGFLSEMYARWTNGTFSDGELSTIVITVATDGSSKIYWQYDVENGYEIVETVIPGFEVILGTDLEGPTRITLDLTDSDPENHMIFWLDMIPGQNRIQRSNLDGTLGAEELVTDLVSPSGITTYDNNLYWSDNVTAEIFKSNMDGSHIELHRFGGPYNAPKAINITTYQPPSGSEVRDSVLTDAGIDKIVIASELGSEGLNQPILYPATYPELSIYFQNNPDVAGFNPNDEHADFFPSTIGSGQNSIFALRDDLTLASQPYVLMRHRSLVDGDWSMKVYQVVRNGFGYNFSEFQGVAGNPFFAPYPVRLLGTCDGTNGSGEPYFEDYKFNTYAKSAGTITARFFYPLQTGFYWDEDAFGPIKNGNCVSWLGGDIYDINSLVESGSKFLASHDAVLNEIDRLPGLLPTGPDQPDWATLLDHWTNQTLDANWDFEPDSDGELDAVIIEVYKNGKSRITWKYWSEFPRVEAKPLEMVTFIETDSMTQEVLDSFLFNYGFQDLEEKYISPMEVTYHIRWPDVPPVLTVGETLLFPKNGLPDIFNQAAVKVIYERPDGEDLDNPRALVNLIDPMSAREVQLVNADLTGIPADVAVENKVGKLVIVGNASGTILVPFSLRARLSFDAVSGKLAFSGYMDTNVAGEPILLLNVLSANERDLLKSLSTNTFYHAVIDELYHYTRNPNQLDLNGDGDPDEAFLLGLENNGGTLVPQSLVGLPKGLTAGSATDTGWVTLVFNDDSRLNPLPVSLSVFRVDCLEYSPNRFSPYIGEIKVIPSDNIFDEQLTLRHSGDFGGNPFDDMNGNGVQDPGEFGLFFEWYYKPDENGVSPPPPEFDVNGTIIPGSGWRPFDQGMGLQEITIEGANLTTLSDNWFFVRYKGYPVCRNDFEFTQLAGDPASTPTHPRAALAEGWIKRVIRRLNAFEARVQDFHAAPTNTYASMIGQLGERYEGPIAMNNDPSNLNGMGLIEAYETVLRRGMSLSVDGTPPINYGPANKALLLVANRIASFYSLLGNEAYSDALDPTIGFDTEGIFGYVAPTLFAFQNQQDSLLAEELTLLRGRDDYSAGVAASPVYNRLYWNFTSGDGEVAYVQAYNIQDQDISGVIDETDARILFPQGHGDAWGHYLTSLNTFYKLLTHPYYTWEPRAEAVTVAGVAIQVDYEDERRFAEVAAQKAKTGARIVNMTYREKYVADPAGQWQGYKDTDEERAWGLSEWARRAGQGAYIDWVVANSILPVEDLANTGLEKIDRTSVFELQSIAGEFATIQSELDKADSGNNPLGLAKGAIAFDIDPSEIDAGKTHFEQIYERAMGNISNALFVFDQANDLSNMLRRNQDTVDEFTGNIYDQDFDFMSRLIEIFGYPYEGDIGPGGTYPLGYDGPDIFHFNYVDYERLTGQNLGRIETWTTAISNQSAMNDWLGDWYDPAGLDPSFRDDPIDKWTDQLKYINEVTYHFVDPPTDPTNPDPGTVSFHDYYHNSNTAALGLVKPDPSWGERQADGEIQFALGDLIQAIAQMDVKVNEYDRHIDTMMGTITDIEQRYSYEIARSTRQWTYFGVVTAIDGLVAISKVVRATLTGFIETVETVKEATKTALPKTVGLSNDVFSAIRAAAETVGGGTKTTLTIIENSLGIAEDIAGMAKDTYGMAKDIELEDMAGKHELGVFIREFEAQVRMEPGLRLELYIQLDTVKSKVAAYKAAVSKGNRLIDELIVFRKNAAAATQDYRYRDMFFRIMRNASLQKYHAQFDLAAKYVYLAAAAYDYETNLLGTNQMAGRDFLTSIVKQRNIGELTRLGGNLYPLPGRAGLADILARMKTNFDVLKPQLGFNNPQIETNRFSIRQQLFRISQGSTQAWQDELTEHRVADIWQIPEFKRYCRPFAPQAQGPQPGIVIPFSTNVTIGMNYFGWPLGSGDSAYDPSNYATRIRSAGVWFTDYDGLNLSLTPRVYLVPVGMDVLRTPDATNFEVREWQLVDQKLPVALPLTLQDVEEPDWIPIHHSLSDEIYDIRQFSAFRAYDDSGTFVPSEVTTDSRLIGRSVWNTRWLLIIPGAYMLSDADAALDSFIQGVSDINFFFETYAYSGNKKTSAGQTDEEAGDSEAAGEATEQQSSDVEVYDEK